MSDHFKNSHGGTVYATAGKTIHLTNEGPSGSGLQLEAIKNNSHQEVTCKGCTITLGLLVI